MNYLRIYSEIINKAIESNGRPAHVTKYRSGFDIHHIKPACMFAGGRKNKKANEAENLVYLTKKQHFLAHWLLAKAYGGKMSSAFAYMCVTHGRSRSSKAFVNHYREGIKTRSASDKTRKKLSKAALERYAKPEEKNKAKALGRRLAADPLWQEKNKKACDKKWSDPVFREKMRLISKEIINRPEVRSKMIESRKNNPDAVARIAAGVRKSRAKKVKGTCLTTGKTKEYGAARDAIADGFTAAGISNCAKGKTRSHKNWFFEFV